MREGERMVIYPAKESTSVSPCGCTAVTDHLGREALFPCVQYMATLAGRGVAA